MSGVVVGDGGCCLDGALQAKWASSAAAAGGRTATRMSSDLDDLSIDADDADERFREEHEPTCRGRTLQFLESNPLQVALYVMVLLDAVVVISEILLDLHAMRSQYREATSDLLEAMNFIKHSFSADLDGYNGDNIQYVLSTLRTKHAPLLPSNFSKHHPGRQDAYPQPLQSMSVIGHKSSARQVTRDVNTGSAEASAAAAVTAYNQRTRSGKRTRRLSSVIGDYRTPFTDGSKFNKSLMQYVDVSSQARKPKPAVEGKDDLAQSTLIEDDATEIDSKTINSDRTINDTDTGTGIGTGTGTGAGSGTALYADDDFNSALSGDDLLDESDSHGNDSVKYYKDYSYSEKLLKIAHILHYIGIGILGFFVIQVSLKVFGMGFDFFKKKFEIFDAIIVLTSFGLDLVFIEGVTGDQTEEAIALLIIFLLWRILRIVNGIMVTSKKRQEFRIQILKRARRRAQKKIEYLEDDKNWREREIANLRRLCSERGAHDDDIAACKPRRRTIFQKMDTSVGLSTIASLSLGVSMSMTGTGRTLIKTLGAGVVAAGSTSLGARLTTDRRRSFNQLFPLLPGTLGAASGNRSRRASFVDILQYARSHDRRASIETTNEGQTLREDRKTPRAVFLVGGQSRPTTEEGQGLDGSSSSPSKKRNSVVEKMEEGRRNLDASDQVDGTILRQAICSDEFSGQPFRSQIPEVTIDAPDDNRASQEQTMTSSIEADDRSGVGKCPGESVELLVGSNRVPKTSFSLPHISHGQGEGDLDLDGNGSPLLDSKETIESPTDTSPSDVIWFKSNDVSNTSTSANCNSAQIIPGNIVTSEPPSCVINQMGNNFTIASVDNQLTYDDVSPNSRSLTSRNSKSEDFAVRLVSVKDGANNPLCLENGNSCRKHTLSCSNFETGNNPQSVLIERCPTLFVSSPKPRTSDNSSSSPAALCPNSTNSISSPMCLGNTNSRPPMLRTVGLAWSRSQELQPKDHNHDSKMSLVKRRRSSNCVCSKRYVVENINK